MAVTTVPLADNQTITNSTTPGYSPVVNMDGANAVQLTVIVAVNSATSVTPSLEGSNDMYNWTTITTGWTAISTVGYSAPSSQGSIAFPYVRIKFAVAGTGTVIFSAYLTTALL